MRRHSTAASHRGTPAWALERAAEERPGLAPSACVHLAASRRRRVVIRFQTRLPSVALCLRIEQQPSGVLRQRRREAVVLGKTAAGEIVTGEMMAKLPDWPYSALT